MAEGILRQIAGDAFEVASAGVSPSHVRPEAISVMHRHRHCLSPVKIRGRVCRAGIRLCDHGLRQR